MVVVWFLILVWGVVMVVGALMCAGLGFIILADAQLEALFGFDEDAWFETTAGQWAKLCAKGYAVMGVVTFLFLAGWGRDRRDPS